jgi:hypothetical protein
MVMKRTKHLLHWREALMSFSSGNSHEFGVGETVAHSAIQLEGVLNPSSKCSKEHTGARSGMSGIPSVAPGECTS